MCAPNYMNPDVKNNVWIEEEENPTVDKPKAMSEFYALYNVTNYSSPYSP